MKIPKKTQKRPSRRERPAPALINTEQELSKALDKRIKGHLLDTNTPGSEIFDFFNNRISLYDFTHNLEANIIETLSKMSMAEKLTYCAEHIYKKDSMGSCLPDEIDWGNKRKLKCNAYWNDDTSFAFDIGEGELIDSIKDSLYKDAIPEFLRHNIVEGDVRNVN